jgi:hypothetical protein
LLSVQSDIIIEKDYAMYTLLKSQKNEVLEIIQEYGLEPANFSWGIGNFTVPSNHPLTRGLIDEKFEVPVLIFINTKFHFQFEMLNGKHHCTFSPGREKPFETQNPGLWLYLTNYVREWLANLKREIEAPDLWAEMEKYKTSVSLDFPEQVRNDPIPVYEAEEIAKKLKELADKIDELFELNTDQRRFVRKKLEYLAESARRQRSMDWVHTSIGVCVTIAMSLTLAPDKARELWQLMKSLIAPFIHLIGS